MEQTSLFEKGQSAPLASRMRPRNLTEFVGQTHLIGEGKLLRKMIESDNISSMVFWGPPGVGKTTLARIIAHETKSKFITFSAVTSGIKEIKKVMEDAENNGEGDQLPGTGENEGGEPTNPGGEETSKNPTIITSLTDGQQVSGNALTFTVKAV